MLASTPLTDETKSKLGELGPVKSVATRLAVPPSLRQLTHRGVAGGSSAQMPFTTCTSVGRHVHPRIGGKADLLCFTCRRISEAVSGCKACRREGRDGQEEEGEGGAAVRRRYGPVIISAGRLTCTKCMQFGVQTHLIPNTGSRLMYVFVAVRSG